MDPVTISLLTGGAYFVLGQAINLAQRGFLSKKDMVTYAAYMNPYLYNMAEMVDGLTGKYWKEKIKMKEWEENDPDVIVLHLYMTLSLACALFARHADAFVETANVKDGKVLAFAKKISTKFSKFDKKALEKNIANPLKFDIYRRRWELPPPIGSETYETFLPSQLIVQGARAAARMSLELNGVIVKFFQKGHAPQVHDKNTMSLLAENDLHGIFPNTFIKHRKGEGFANIMIIFHVLLARYCKDMFGHIRDEMEDETKYNEWCPPEDQFIETWIEGVKSDIKEYGLQGPNLKRMVVEGKYKDYGLGKDKHLKLIRPERNNSFEHIRLELWDDGDYAVNSAGDLLRLYPLLLGTNDVDV